MSVLTIPGADDKNATVTLSLKAKSGYRSTEAHQISANQWGDIIAICVDNDRAKTFRAADDLLAACKAVIKELNHDGSPASYRAMGKVTAAIAKATGQEGGAL